MMSYKKQELFTLREYLASPLSFLYYICFGGIRVANHFSFLCYFVIVFIFCSRSTSCVQCVDCSFLIAPSDFAEGNCVILNGSMCSSRCFLRSIIIQRETTRICFETCRKQSSVNTWMNSPIQKSGNRRQKQMDMGMAYCLFDVV